MIFWTYKPIVILIKLFNCDLLIGVLSLDSLVIFFLLSYVDILIIS